MGRFDERILAVTGAELRSAGISTLMMNVGLRCNQSCRHCHHSCSPLRDEEMGWPVMQTAVEAAAECGCGLVDITGGSPELNEHFRDLVDALFARGIRTQVRTNLTVLLEAGQETTADFLADRGVNLLASLPGYTRENVEPQRGEGVYGRSVRVLRMLNDLGYGLRPELALTLVHNPGATTLPPGQVQLEANYRRELAGRHGIEFSRLITITNMPLGRFGGELDRAGGRRGYLDMLECSFNPAVVSSLVCLTEICVGWDGTLHDCDFNLALGLPVDRSVPSDIREFDVSSLSNRRIVTGRHCFACTAGAGSS